MNPLGPRLGYGVPAIASGLACPFCHAWRAFVRVRRTMKCPKTLQYFIADKIP